MADLICFTKRLLTTLHQPGERADYRDTKTPGLLASLRPGGTFTFYLYRRIDGRPVRLRLGTFPAMTVEQARDAAARHNGQIADGHNPQTTRRMKREQATFGELADHWIEAHAKPRKRTWKKDQSKCERILKHWANRPLSSITKAEVHSLHNRLGRERGCYGANRVLSLVRAMFNKADDLGFQGENPCRGVKKFPEEKRDRFLHRDELPRFFESLAQEPNATFRDFFLTCLLTGARRGNVESMCWADIDMQQAVWRIPQTKRGEPQTVPLSPPLVKLLTDRKAITNGNEWVFPGQRSKHLTESKAAWTRLRARANLPGLRLHDLRRSLGSWQAMTGASLPIIGASLGHTEASTTMVYARLQLAPVREAVDKATAAMMVAGGLLPAPKPKTRKAK